MGEENFLILMETNSGLNISNEIKLFGTTREEVELKKFNIFIGISLGNKLLTKELAKAYVEWAVERTKDNVAVLIADEIDAVNWVIFNNLDEASATEKVSNKAQGLNDMFSRALKIIAREKDSTIENRVKVIRWKDIKTERFNKLLTILESEFETNLDFRNRVLSFVKKYCELRKKSVAESDQVKLSGYILAELPTLLEGIEFNGILYNMIFYPTYIDSGMSQFVLDIQNGIYPNLLSKLQLSVKCVMAESYFKKPGMLFD